MSENLYFFNETKSINGIDYCAFPRPLPGNRKDSTDRRKTVQNFLNRFFICIYVIPLQKTG